MPHCKRFLAVKHEKRSWRPAKHNFKGTQVPARKDKKNPEKWSDTKDAQSEFNEAIIGTLHRQMKGVMTVIQQQDPSLREVSSELQITR
jgi:hypothetical protein